MRRMRTAPTGFLVLTCFLALVVAETEAAVGPAFGGPTRVTDPNTDGRNRPADEVTIANVQVLFLQRDEGKGRVAIEGTGFGQYAPPPLTASDDLLLCLEERGKKGKSVSEPNCGPMDEWRRKVEQALEVVLIPRNPSLRVKTTRILYADDKLIDVFFQFTRFQGYSQPFRLAGVSLTVNKLDAKQGIRTYRTSKIVTPARDENLSYRFTVLDKDSANYLFGRGVADNFYVIQLSVVNNGGKKVAIPLASIQAEIEWARGKSQTDSDTEYLEGPPTLSPIPLAGVSAFFDAYVKTKGKRATLFNILEGVTTVGSTLIPIFGSGFKDAHVIYSGGVIPGLRKASGDLSGQQLQNLTGLSWEGREVVSPRGGSVDKFVYVQRGEQLFSTPTKNNVKPIVKKEIKNILGLEVIGFEILESEAKTAAQQ